MSRLRVLTFIAHIAALALSPAIASSNAVTVCSGTSLEDRFPFFFMMKRVFCFIVGPVLSFSCAYPGAAVYDLRMATPRPPRSQAGFTWVELMFVIAVQFAASATATELIWSKPWSPA